MKKIILLFILLFPLYIYSQDLLIPDNPYDKADDQTRSSNAFQRERWFYEQRMFPNNTIPADAYEKAYRQKEEMNSQLGFAMNGIFDSWVTLGPKTGFYFSYSNITSRTTTVKYDPTDPNKIYIGTAFGGVWKSVNGGNNWTAMSDNEVSLASGSIAIDPDDPNIIYYGTGEATYSAASYYGRGLLKSTDGGATWTNYTSGLGSFSLFSKIIIRPGHNNEILATMGTKSSVGVSGGIYRSTNAGVSWTLLNSGRADDIVFSPTGDTAYAVGSGIGYRISTNGGATFNSNGAISMGTRNHIAICKSSPNVLYHARHSSSSIFVYKSTDAGFTFFQIAAGQNFNGGQAWYDFYMHVNPFNPDYAYTSAVDVWRTTNGGATNFTNITNGYGGGGVHVDQHNLDFHPTDPSQMVCVNDGGIWKSTNYGTNWTNMNTDQTLTQFYRIASDPSNANHILGGTQDNGTQRTIGTINWTAAYGGDGGDVCFHSQNNNYILGETQNNGVFRSTNGGSSFSSATSGLSGSGSWVGPLLSHQDSAGIFYTARQQVFKSTNWGASWFAISTGTSGTIRELAISNNSGNVMYASSGSTIYRSTNHGYNFTDVTSGLPGNTITSISVHPDSSNVAVITFSGFGSGKIYKTTNTGGSWTNITGNLPDSPVNTAVIYHPGYPTSVYFCGSDIGVFVTHNYGQTWQELANGLPNTVAIHLDHHLATNKLRIGTHGRGVFEIQLSNFIFADIKMIPEGYYDQGLNRLNRKDTVSAYIRNSVSPYNVIDSSKAVIDSITFNGNFVFNNVASGNYYLKLKHKNTLETWSRAGGETITQGIGFSYDFTPFASNAFGNNMVQVDFLPVRYAFYSGDINDDGIVDINDMGYIENDIFNFTTGYAQSDLNGDGTVDLADITFADNNSFNFITKITP
ncbi:MAG: hypothetical protein JSS91_07880 [Bacteroidetes bacterium]|nr:hypothetical protein [Bacteroidota bacterium]